MTRGDWAAASDVNSATAIETRRRRFMPPRVSQPADLVQTGPKGVPVERDLVAVDRDHIEAAGVGVPAPLLEERLGRARQLPLLGVADRLLGGAAVVVPAAAHLDEHQ